MTDYADIDTKLEEYSRAFDDYVETGAMPDSISKYDYLAEYMREVIDNNELNKSSDPIWIEVIKDELMSFFALLLEHIKVLQIEAMQELNVIAQFKMSTLKQKHEMWRKVHEIISNNYSEYDVNISGYAAQLKSDDNEAVFAAVADDWEVACRARIQQQERQILTRAKNQFARQSHEVGKQDYADKKRLDKLYPSISSTPRDCRHDWSRYRSGKE